MDWNRKHKKPVGKIIWNDGGFIEYLSPADFLDAVKKTLSHYGITGWSYEVLWNDLDFKYDIHRAIMGEMGETTTRSDFVIQTTDPAFNLQEKLKAIYEYEIKNVPAEYRITQDVFGGGDNVLIADRIDCSMSVRSIKKLIDKWYGKALKAQERHRIDIMDIPPPDYPPDLDKDFKEPVGRIIYHHDPDKVTTFHNPAQMLDELGENLYNYGNSGYTCEPLWEDLDFRYAIHKLYVEERGGVTTRSNFLIEETDPAFNLQEKLKVINSYEEKHIPPDKRITFNDLGIIVFAERIDNMLTPNNVKKLIDEQYNIALKNQDRPASYAEPPKNSVKDMIEAIKAGAKNLTGTNTEIER